MKLRRDIASVPLRNGDEAWLTAVNLLTQSDSNDTDQLTAATSVMGALLTEDYYAQYPLTVVGKSHRVVLYFAYGTDAIEIGTNVDGLNWNPTTGDWKIYVPCAEEHISWAKRLLSTTAPRFFVHGFDESPAVEESEETSADAEPLKIDWSVN